MNRPAGGQPQPSRQVNSHPDRAAARDEMNQARQEFRQLLAAASRADLRRPSDGTRWTNRQLLFHMLLGYLVTRTLLPLARVLGRLPRPASQAFACLLDAASRPFHLVNYLGSCAGARAVSPARMVRMMDTVTAALQRSLDKEASSVLRRGMHYPRHWDPLFGDYMTLAALYRYPTRHYRYHQRQLTLTSTPGPEGAGAARDGRR